MNAKILLILFSVTLLASSVLAELRLSANSNVFTVDTRYLSGAEVSYSNIFILNLPLYSTGAWAQSPTNEFETRPAYGDCDFSSSMASFVLDTVDGLNVGEFYIVGPSSISSGQTGTYQMFLQTPSSGQASNISNQARLRLQGGNHPNVGIGGRTVFAYDVEAATEVTLYATYQRTDGQVASAPFSLTLTPQGLGVSASASKTDLGGGSFQINLSAEASGGAGGYSYAWDLDGDGNFNDAAGSSASVERSTYGTHTFQVLVADSLGTTADAVARITLNKPLAPNQPTREAEDSTFDPPSVVDAGRLYDYAGRPLTDPLCDFTANRKSNGLIIITHGMRESYYGGTNWWPFDIAQAIKDRYDFLGQQDNMPNILVYDWTESATPSKPSEASEQVVINRVAEGLSYLGQVWSAGKNGVINTLVDPLAGFVIGSLPYGDKLNVLIDLFDPIGSTAKYGVDVSRFIIDTDSITDIALSYGSSLGAWVQLNSGFGESIDIEAPIHLIGHSAGGFVVGEAALELYQRWGIVTDRVTMLDTPMPWLAHYSVLPDPVYVERIGASALGVIQFKALGKIPFNQANPFYENYLIPEFIGSVTDFLAEHRQAYVWYQLTVENYQSPVEPIGFERSPLQYGPKANKGAVSSEPSALSAFTMAADTLEPADPWAEFQSFGNVAGTGTERTVTEVNDSGLWKEIIFPIGAATLDFEAQFDSESDGDFLAVTFDGEMLRTVANLPTTAGSFRKFIVPISQMAGETGTLSFTLVSRGEANALLRLRNFAVTEDSDIDGDGVSNELEIAQGTDPLMLDTDGDFLPDGAEEPESDPLLADTDGDGSNDLAERIAGTDPRDPNSVFKVSELQAGTSTFALWWKSIPGKTYRVIWSESPDFSEFEVIASDLTAAGYETNYIDYVKPASNPEKGFYRLEVVGE